MNSQNSWFKKILSGSGAPGEARARLEELVAQLDERDAKIESLTSRLVESEHIAQTEMARVTGLSERAQALAHRLAEVEQSRAALEASLVREDNRVSELKAELQGAQAREAIAVEAAATSQRVAKNLAGSLRRVEKELCQLQTERTQGKQDQRDLQNALSVATQGREQMRMQNQKLVAQLRVTELDRDQIEKEKQQAAVESSRRIVDVETCLNAAMDLEAALRLQLDDVQRRLAVAQAESVTLRLSADAERKRALAFETEAERARRDARALTELAAAALQEVLGNASPFAFGVLDPRIVRWLRDRVAGDDLESVMHSLAELAEQTRLAAALRLVSKDPLAFEFKLAGVSPMTSEPLGRWLAAIFVLAIDQTLTCSHVVESVEVAHGVVSVAARQRPPGQRHSDSPSGVASGVQSVSSAEHAALGTE